MVTNAKFSSLIDLWACRLDAYAGCRLSHNWPDTEGGAK
jgi:hypothetical protein